MIEDKNLNDAEPKMTSAEQRVEEFEKRMNYKAKLPSQEAQDRFDTKFHNSIRMRRWVE